MEFREHYTELVEHFFRMAVRYSRVDQNTPSDWFDFTRTWIDMQSEEDKAFIRFVFDYQFYKTGDGLYNFKGTQRMPEKRSRLAALEKQFAIDGGLI